jgi:hypothetical protein
MSLADHFDHLSVSHATDFLEYRPKWFMCRVLGHKLSVGPSAHRGAAVEEGVNAVIFRGASIEEGIEEAHHTFDAKAADCDLDKAAEAKADLNRLVEAGVKAMEALEDEHGPVRAIQHRLFAKLPSGTVPWLGFADYVMQDGTIVDLKTAGRSKGSLPAAWGRQGAFYQYAAQCEAQLAEDYTTTLEPPAVKFVCLVSLKKEVKVETIPLEHAAFYLHQLQQVERALDAILSLGDPATIAPFFLPSGDEFWMDDEARALSRQVWR